jgi:hypothetical protein
MRIGYDSCLNTERFSHATAQLLRTQAAMLLEESFQPRPGPIDSNEPLHRTLN